MKTAKKSWNIYNNGTCLGSFTLHDVCRVTGISRSSVPVYADKGTLYKGIYKFERVEDDLQTDWDVTTGRLLAAMKKKA